MKNETKTNPSCDLISRADAIGAIANAEPKDNEYHYYKHIAIKILSEIPSIEVEPSWTCTANFVAEQLERLKDMTDGERLNLLQTMFTSVDTAMRDATAEERASVQRYIDSISVEVVQGEWIKSKSAKGYVVCSNCNKLTTNINCKKYNYCPFCGARMKGASHETNKR